MEYTQLGRTGLTVSRAGFGGGGIGQVWGATTEDEAIASVHRALDLGITFFDVAPSYGDGRAEEALGKALEGRSEPVVVATKVRLRADEMDDVDGAVRRSVEVSLLRLRRDSVDVLHVHNRFTETRGEGPDSITGGDVMGPVLEAYRAVQREGKTRFIGLSAMDHHLPTMHRLLESNEWDTVLAYYNLLNWTAQAAMVFSLMNRDIHSTVPGVKNRAEAEETAACVDLPPVSPEHLARLTALYNADFQD